MATIEPRLSKQQAKRADAVGGPRQRQDALGNKLADPEEECVLIEKELEGLKISFEQFFLGMDRHSPIRRKDILGERIRKLKNAGNIRNTGLKFKLEQLSQKFSTYERMWQRTINEIEAGTYKRDLFKMKLHQARKEGAAPAEEHAPARAAPPPENSLSDGQLRALFDTYLVARKRTNEPVDGITYDNLSQSIRKQVPMLMKKYECKAIDFKVVIKDGRAQLKAVPRK